MAQRVTIQLVSDLSGEAIEEGAGSTVSYSLDGSTWELDLTNEEADSFRGLFQDYIAVSRKVGRATGTAGKRSTVATPGSGMSKAELANIRAWAKENGHAVSERGRIAQSIIDAYKAAI